MDKKSVFERGISHVPAAVLMNRYRQTTHVDDGLALYSDGGKVRFALHLRRFPPPPLKDKVLKELKHILKASKKQRLFCERFGLHVEGDTERVAIAKILDLIDREFYGMEALDRPTPKQVDLAAEFGYDISGDTKRVGEAVITNLMTELNLESIEQQKLAIGVRVVNKWDKLATIEIISSIRPNGLVYLKGGNGKKAWARNLKTKITKKDNVTISFC